MEHEQPPSVPDDPYRAPTPQAPDVTGPEFMSHSFHTVFLVRLSMLSIDPFTLQCTVQSQIHSIPFSQHTTFCPSQCRGGLGHVHKHCNKRTGGHILALLLEIIEKARVSIC